ncbi:MAG: transposase, partial [Planctomycetota bacterium]
VYAAAIVHTAFRIAQADIGERSVRRGAFAVRIRKVRQLSRTILAGAGVEDRLVAAGTGRDSMALRLIILRKGSKTYEAVTNVLDPTRLSSADAVLLYPSRWRIERLFYDLEEVRNPKKFYAANPNAVAMQVYAAAIVHTAFRIAQADIGERSVRRGAFAEEAHCAPGAGFDETAGCRARLRGHAQGESSLEATETELEGNARLDGLPSAYTRGEALA